MSLPSQDELNQLHYQKERDAFIKTTVWSILLANLLMLIFPPLFFVGLLIPWGWTRPNKPLLRGFDCDMNYHITIWGICSRLLLQYSAASHISSSALNI